MSEIPGFVPTKREFNRLRTQKRKVEWIRGLLEGDCTRHDLLADQKIIGLIDDLNICRAKASDLPIEEEDKLKFCEDIDKLKTYLTKNDLSKDDRENAIGISHENIRLLTSLYSEKADTDADTEMSEMVAYLNAVFLKFN